MAAPRYVYGTSIMGSGPDSDNFRLGGEDEDYTRNLRDYARNTGSIAMARGHQSGGKAAALGTDAGAASADARTRTAPGSESLTRSSSGGMQQENLASRLRSFAEAPEAPSAAQAQLQAGTNEALNSQLALARSGGGFGESAAGLTTAAGNAANIQGNASAEAARLRAQETQAHRAQQLQAYGASGDVLGDMRAGYAQDAGTAIDAQGLNDQTALGWADANRDAIALESDVVARGLDQGLDAERLGLDAETAALEGRVAYDQTLTDLYGMNLEHTRGQRELDQQADRDVWGAIGGGLASIGGLALLSDIRSKKNVRRTNLDEDYEALGGDAYNHLADPEYEDAQTRDRNERDMAKRRQAASHLFQSSRDFMSRGRRA